MKNTLLFKNYFYVVLLLFLVVSQVSISQTRTTPGVAQTFNITSPSQLTATYSSNLIPGDIVVLADNPTGVTYTAAATMKFNAVGTAANPITLKAATPGGSKFTNGQQLKIGGDYVIVDGFYWQGGAGASNFIEFRDGSDYANNSTLQNCVVDGLTGTSTSTTSVKHNWVMLYGTNNTVINCSFMNKTTSGNMILAEYQFNASPLGDDATNTRCDPVGHTIMNNYFYNYSKIDPALSNSGDSETIRIGTSEYQNVHSNAVVQNNYFVMADGENEIITNKSKGNSYINNTFRKCRGSLVLRHGSHGTVVGNYFLGEDIDGTGGVRIVDSNHTITNNYIQDCITVGDNAIWNNGITFLGGSAANAVDCSVQSGLSNQYQKPFDLNLSNNTIVNTNAPLYFNTNTGTTKPTGTVANNLIYFVDGDPNTTAVITGNTTSPIAMGTSLTYSGNEFKGTTVGQTTYSGFAVNEGITANLNADGETYSFSGTTKGATMNFPPINDDNVGLEIGACFVNSSGVKITNGNCNIVIPESLIVGTTSEFTNVAGSQNVIVTANVSWSAAPNNAWITTISPNTGTGDATVSVTVTANTGTESRTGTVTFTQTSGTGSIVRTLTVSQAAPPPPDPRDGLNLINVLASDAAVAYVSNEEIFPDATPTPKDNQAIHSLDKDPNTQWAGNGALDPEGSNNAIIIYDLKGTFDLDLVDIATTNTKTYKLQIWVSSTGIANEDFTNPFPAGDLISNTDASFKAFVLPTSALGTKYVKIIGNGQTTGTTRFTTLHEVEFYGEVAGTAGVDDFELAKYVQIFPIPANNILNIKLLNTTIKSINLFDVTGRKLMQKNIKTADSEASVDVSKYSNGVYFVNFLGENGLNLSKRIVIAH